MNASTTRTTFSRTTTASTLIHADAAVIWALLTNAADMPRWNSQVLSVEGTVELGSKIALRSALAPKRTFKLKVKALQPGQRMVWGDAQGQRTYTLEPQPQGKVRFTMTERIGGPLFPLFAGMIPSFDKSFDAFAADLKREAEGIMKSNG